MKRGPLNCRPSAEEVLALTTIPVAPLSAHPDPQVLALHVLRALSTTSRERRPPSLDELAIVIGALRGDVRRTLSALHRGGSVDVLRMRLTLTGFALAKALADFRLRPVRAERAAHRVASVPREDVSIPCARAMSTLDAIGALVTASKRRGVTTERVASRKPRERVG